MRDCDIRAVLKPRLKKRFERTPSLIVDELGFDGHIARIDVAVVNCSLHGYEIKSERDTLSRLDQQLGHYANQFHYVTVVAADKHLDGVLAMSPVSVGLIRATMQRGRVVLRQVRRPRSLGQTADRIARLFWWPEALAVLEKHNLAKGAKRLNGDMLRSRLLDHFTAPQLLEELRETLAGRRAEQSHTPRMQDDGLSRWF